jgi:hypothetical protein
MRQRWWIGGLLLALAIAGLLSPWASAWPDGLDRVASRLDFAGREREQAIPLSPLADYKVAGIRERAWSTAAAGTAGTLLVFGGVCLLAAGLTRRRPE